ncbi:MAG: MarR family transcriptional regulator [Acidobacteria bacterium]|nr:MarR family transcriptional regulator [Acidobacteriota bacterium]
MPCACAILRRAARAVTQLYDRELRKSGVSPPQLTLLQALSKTGEVTQGALGELLALDSTTLSRTLKPLEQMGWISNRPGRDRRERWLALTADGRNQLERSQPAWDQVQDRLRERLGAEAWEELLPLLARVAAAARDL